MRKLGSIYTIMAMMLAFPSCRAYAGQEASRLSIDNSMVGVFMQKSPLCTDPAAEDGVCAEKFQDCLSVKKSGNAYRVNLYSVQARQSICSFSYLMKPVHASALAYTSPKHGAITVTFSHGKILVNSNGFDASAAGNAICGAYADIDGIEFSKDSKVPQAPECPSPIE